MTRWTNVYFCKEGEKKKEDTFSRWVINQKGQLQNCFPDKFAYIFQ